MRMPRSAMLAAVAAISTACLTAFTAGPGAGRPTRPITVDMMQVADLGNIDDYTGYGAVDHPYSIARYEVTIGEYLTFLNSVAASDPYGLYNPDIAEDPNIAGISRSGQPGSYAYAAMTITGDSSNRPVTFVSWFDSARFANWMSNGQPGGTAGPTTTENGAYRLDGAVGGLAPAANAINPNTGAVPTFRLPTEDEWYKAGYYDPTIAPDRGVSLPGRNDINPNTGQPPAYYLPTEDQWFKAAYYDPAKRGGRGGYWTYATRSDGRPGNVIGTQPNQANYNNGTYSTTQSEAFNFVQNYLTNAGAFSGAASAYGTFDQNGNVLEWNDLGAIPSYVKGFRGGSWYNTSGESDMAREDSYEYNPLSASDVVGIRLAGPISTRRSGALRPALVRIGNPGNGADPDTGYGAVAAPYAFAKYEVTIGQYTAFLNAVAANDPHGLFNPRMTTIGNLAGITRSGTPGSYHYTVMQNGGTSANRPIGFVSWYDAARFANWMANGQPTGAQTATTTEDGAYGLSKLHKQSTAVAPGNGGYYVFPTQSNSTPGNVIGSTPNQANYGNAHGLMSTTQSLGIFPRTNYLTDVGAFTASASHYGTFDQIGNVYEWNDMDGSSSMVRGIRGSCWFGTLVYAQDISKLSRGLTAPTDESTSVGFRLAGP